MRFPVTSGHTKGYAVAAGHRNRPQSLPDLQA